MSRLTTGRAHVPEKATLRCLVYPGAHRQTIEHQVEPTDSLGEAQRKIESQMFNAISRGQPHASRSERRKQARAIAKGQLKQLKDSGYFGERNQIQHRAKVAGLVLPDDVGLLVSPGRQDGSLVRL